MFVKTQKTKAQEQKLIQVSDTPPPMNLNSLIKVCVAQTTTIKGFLRVQCVG